METKPGSYNEWFSSGTSRGTGISSRGTTARGGRRGRNGSSFRRGSSEPQISAPAGAVIESISSTDIKVSGLSDVVLKIQGLQDIASYNWLDHKTPTIIVPGAPPAWTPPNDRSRLKEDSGSYFRDPNAARYPQYPTEPGIQAALELHPDFNFDTIDVVGCGSTLGNLLRFAASKPATFKMNAEIIQDTLFLVRQERVPTQLIEGVHGYGHTFPEAYTTWDAATRGSSSNQRLVQYHFGDLKCLVRFECDGYLKEKAIAPAKKDALPPKKSPPSQGGGLMASMLKDIDSVNLAPDVHTDASDLTVKHAGHQIPQAAVFDLKTRSARVEIDMEEFYPRLWVRQIPNFVIAYHRSGLFEDIQVKDVQEELRDWESENTEVLHRFHAALCQIKKVTGRAKARKVQIFRGGDGPLQVHEHHDSSWSALSPELRTSLGSGDTG